MRNPQYLRLQQFQKALQDFLRDYAPESWSYSRTTSLYLLALNRGPSAGWVLRTGNVRMIVCGNHPGPWVNQPVGSFSQLLRCLEQATTKP